MTSFLCDQLIDFDAINAYESQHIEQLINRIEVSVSTADNSQVVVLLRNAHYLTTKAFALLYNYMRSSQISGNLLLVLVSTDKSKIFPPLLDFVQTAV